MHVETAAEIALLRALALADRLQQEHTQLIHQNVQLAGQVGFMQSALQQAREQIRLLTVDKEPEPEAPQHHISWWRRMLGR